MAYVLTTFFIMGFGYFVAVTALNGHSPESFGHGLPLDNEGGRGCHHHSHRGGPGTHFY